MTRTALFLLLPTFTTGCIIYDGNCRKGDCRWDDTADRDDEGLGEDTGEVAEASFAIDPAEVGAGDVVIASLTAENFDLTTVTEVEVYGDVTLVAAANRGDELLLTLNVADDAAEGAADFLLHVGDDVEFIEALLVVHAADYDGQTDEDTDGDGNTDDGNTDDGSGTDDTGSDCG